MSLDRLSGRYPPSSCPSVHINWFGVIPKNHHQDNWCLNTNFFHLSGSGVNDGISSELCTLTYVNIDNAILNILQSGRNTMLANLMLKVWFAYPQCIQQICTCWGWNGEAIYTLIIAFPFCSVQQLNGLTSLLIFWLSRCWTTYTFTTGSWKIRGHYNIVVLLWNYTEHKVHGDKATSRQDNQD